MSTWYNDILNSDGPKPNWFYENNRLHVTDGWIYGASLEPEPITIDQTKRATPAIQARIQEGITTGEPVAVMVIDIDLLKRMAEVIQSQYAVLEFYECNNGHMLALESETEFAVVMGARESEFDVDRAWRGFRKETTS